MFTFALYLMSSLLHLLASTTVAEPPAYTPIDYFLLNCGSSSNSTSLDGRSWDGDGRSKFSASNIDNASSASKASEQDPSVNSVPFMTARIFHSKFTYSFPISTGPKFVRLYFYPATYTYSNNNLLDTSKSFFSVAAANHTLLTNFSAFLTVTAMIPKQASFIKEFIVNVQDNQQLDITFVPSANSYAFVNGIEVVSMPNNLYVRGDEYPIPMPFDNRQQQQFFYADNNTALETLYRLNVGGQDVTGNKDTGMYRTWRQDDMYIYGQATGSPFPSGVPIRYNEQTPAYTAPAVVYATSRSMGVNATINMNYNLTWVFTVDSGFGYLVRLHFCEILPEVTLENQRIFTVFLNNQTADVEVDVIHLSGGNGIPVFKDYVVWVPVFNGRPGEQNFWLALHPNIGSKPTFANALLNGLEIFKLNKSDGSLAGPNPEPQLVGVDVVAPAPPAQKKKSKGSSSLIGGVLGGIVAAVVSVLGFLIFRRRRRVKDSGASVAKSSRVTISYNTTRSTGTNTSSLPADICRHFSLAELKSATRNFNDDFLIGTGGFGNVYKGYIIDNGTITVAIKRLNPSSNQGAREFQTEIETLSKLRHLHLVSLIGYCDDDGEMILVYDYMARGTLRDHLYKTTKNPPLSWKQRLQISIGAARGLHYLHTGAKHIIIHRDVKSSNILLDEKWVAKVSDFGLSKMGPVGVDQTHVSTVVKGSFGYVDPEYYRRRQLTYKSDVYSFGVVLLEVLCGRAAIMPGLAKEQVSLAQWGRYCWQKGMIDQIVDPHLKGQIAAECLRKFGEIVESCLRDSGMERPSMNDVVWSLEFALQLQEAAERNIINGTGDDEFGMLSPSVPFLQRGGGATTSDDGEEVFTAGSKSSGTISTVESGGRSVNSNNSNAPDGLTMSEAVFSEIRHPKGR